MTLKPKYDPTDPVAATMGFELETAWEVLVLIDVGLETTMLVDKKKVPVEFRQQGLPVWLLSQDDGDLAFEPRTTKVTAELAITERVPPRIRIR